MKFGIALVSLAVAGWAQAPSLRSGEQLARDVLKRWETRTGVEIADRAEKRIAAEVTRAREHIREWQRVEPGSERERTLMTELMRDYCFTLAQRQVRKAQGWRLLAVADRRVIEESDVRAFSFAAFLEYLRSWIGPRAAGYLEVSCTQPGAAVYVDAQPSPRGYVDVVGAAGRAVRSFVLDAGSHAVRVEGPSRAFRCDSKIEIRQNARETIQCPPPGSKAAD